MRDPAAVFDKGPSDGPRRLDAWRRIAAWCDPRAAMFEAIAPRIGVGRLAIDVPDGGRLMTEGAAPGPDAALELHRWRGLRRMLTGGTTGFAEAYMNGDWSSPDLAALLELVARNAEILSTHMRGLTPLRILDRLRHAGRRNTRRGSRRNIEAHYDLGNDFFQHWLDQGMSYSSAIFARADDSLEAAQTAKQRRVADLLDLRGGERVLEIGCGWGGLAEMLARDKACHVTAITLSREQLCYAAERVRAAGLDARVDLRLVDYRDVGGTYDRIVSIEMIEAVGEENWPAYFDTLRRRLVAGGVAVLQAITIGDAHFASYRRGADFVQRHIFPGGMLPSPKTMREQIERAGLVLAVLDTFGQSYAKTLAEWQRRFQESWPQIAALGFPPRFKRMWEFYLAYCEAGFRAARIDVGLYRIETPRILNR
jgi:cyclopropane-fatty-acyl-phospholipid synthase